MRPTPALLLAIAGALACSGARADSTSNVELDGLRITLVDLDPTDGIAPSLHFAAGDSAASTAVDGQKDLHFASPLFGPATSSLRDGAMASATASASGDLFGSGMTLRGASFAARGAGATDAESYDALGYFVSPVWVLSPHTRMEVTGIATVDASIGGAGSGSSQFAEAWVYFQVYSDALGYGNFALDATAKGDTPSRSAQGDIDLTLANTTASPAWGWLNGSANAIASVTPVPEPASPALALAGLGVLAGLSSLRRAHGRPA